MNEDAQAALLKTLEEPPAGVTIVLCADDEDPSAADRPLALRADPARSGRVRATSRRSSPTTASPIRRPAARLGRLAGGRPGLALAYAARAGCASPIRGGTRPGSCSTCSTRSPSARLAAVRAAIPRALALAADLSEADRGGGGHTGRPARRRPGDASSGRGPPRRRAVPTRRPGHVDAAGAGDEADARRRRPGRAGPRRPQRAPARAEILIDVWTDVARDLALVGGGRRGVRPRPGDARGD